MMIISMINRSITIHSKKELESSDTWSCMKLLMFTSMSNVLCNLFSMSFNLKESDNQKFSEKTESILLELKKRGKKLALLSERDFSTLFFASSAISLNYRIMEKFKNTVISYIINAYYEQDPV